MQVPVCSVYISCQAYCDYMCALFTSVVSGYLCVVFTLVVRLNAATCVQCLHR